MSDGNRKPTNVEMFLLKPFEKNNLTRQEIVSCDCTFTPNFSCSKVVAYAFTWFIKFHGFTILTGTTKIGIQQII